MHARKAQQDEIFGENHVFRVATWNLRISMVRLFPEQTWACEDLRKWLTELQKDGLVMKDEEYSRIGQAVWKLVDK